MTHECKGSVYLSSCMSCCVRLVLSARPSRKHQEAMLAYLIRHGKFTKDEIIDSIKATTAK